jgi:hypothetical protein
MSDECNLKIKTNEEKFKQGIKTAIGELDKVIQKTTKDLPIAKLYQVVRIGAQVAYGLHSLKSGKLKTLLQGTIIKLLKIFNIYFFILRAKIQATLIHTGTNDRKNKHLEKIYKLDLIAIDIVLDEFYDMSTSDKPITSFFSKANPDATVEKFSAVTDKLEKEINIALGRLTLLLTANTKYSIDLNLAETEEFEILNSPIKSEDCNDMDFETIFTEIVTKIKKLQDDLDHNTKLIEQFKIDNKREKKKEEVIVGETSCPPGEKPMLTDTWGAPIYICGKIPTKQVDLADIDRTINTSGNAAPVPSSNTISGNSTPMPSSNTSTSKDITPVPVSTPTPPPAKKGFFGFFSRNSKKSKYLKYKQKYLIEKNKL